MPHTGNRGMTRKQRQIERCYREFKPTQTRKAQRIPFTGRVFVFDNPRLRAIYERNQSK